MLICRAGVLNLRTADEVTSCWSDGGSPRVTMHPQACDLRRRQRHRSRIATGGCDGDGMTHHHRTVDASLAADVVIVGGGIVGGALATVLAREGIGVIVLERDSEQRDRNKGENLMPWGWVEADLLDLTTVLEVAGGLPNPVWDIVHPDGSSRPVPVAALHPDAPGTTSLAHPAACRALAEAARSAGADLRLGATHASVRPGPAPEVTWREHGTERRARARLVIGADGRGSAVRRQLGMELRRTDPTHTIGSVLVEDVHDIGDHVTVVGGDGQLLLVIPLGDDRARLYVVTRDRMFGGIEGARELIASSQMRAAPSPERWAGAPAGPCATFGGEDAWVDRPVAEGCVLVGDAAGYNSPIIGQGLSLAMRDARLVAEAILSEERWSAEAFAPYAAERAERLRRVRFIAQLWARVRLASDEHLLAIRDHPLLTPIIMGIFTGFDDVDPELFTAATAVGLLSDTGEAAPMLVGF